MINNAIMFSEDEHRDSFTLGQDGQCFSCRRFSGPDVVLDGHSSLHGIGGIFLIS
jgi:hypothetical protein